MTALYHTPVLLKEVLSYLLTSTGGVYVDTTLGGGGHAEAILDRLESVGKLIGIDADKDAIEFSSDWLKRFGDRIVLKKENFRNLRPVLSQLGISSVAGILFDLGVSSFQLDEPGKGFSYRTDDPLDMRMDKSQTLSALEVVNEYREPYLADVLWNNGEERHSRRIAKAIVGARGKQRIQSTGQLAGIVERVVGTRFLNKSLARVFQAIRMEVNNELENLRSSVKDAIELLAVGGRVVVISYHSLEDRTVKEVFRNAAASRIPSGTKMVADTEVLPSLRILTKKPVVATRNETRTNPRARSAKLRAGEKI